jgi:dihydrofolate reductase
MLREAPTTGLYGFPNSERKEVEMRKIQAGLFMTLNGVVQDPGTWSMPYFSDDVGRVISENMAAADAMLLGRRTYEEWVGYWPGKTAEDDPFAGFINSVPKYVVSQTLSGPLSWEGATLVTGDTGAAIRALKEQPGKNIAISGSITLVESLLTQGLLDELALLVSPIVLGAGRRLFDGPAGSVPLRLVQSETLDRGVLALRYVPEGK